MDVSGNYCFGSRKRCPCLLSDCHLFEPTTCLFIHFLSRNHSPKTTAWSLWCSSGAQERSRPGEKPQNKCWPTYHWHTSACNLLILWWRFGMWFIIYITMKRIQIQIRWPSSACSPFLHESLVGEGCLGLPLRLGVLCLHAKLENWSPPNLWLAIKSSWLVVVVQSVNGILAMFRTSCKSTSCNFGSLTPEYMSQKCAVD